MTSTGDTSPARIHMPFVPCRKDFTTSLTPRLKALPWDAFFTSLCSFLVSFSSASGEEIGLRALSRSWYVFGGAPSSSSSVFSFLLFFADSPSALRLPMGGACAVVALSRGGGDGVAVRECRSAAILRFNSGAVASQRWRNAAPHPLRGSFQPYCSPGAEVKKRDTAQYAASLLDSSGFQVIIQDSRNACWAVRAVLRGKQGKTAT